MTLDEIMNLSCKDDEGKVKLNKALRKIKTFRDYEEISLEQLEKFVKKVVYKYDVTLQYITISRMDGRLIYTLSTKNDKGEWLGTVYAISMYELFAKLSIKLYSMIKNEEVKKRC